MNTTNLVVISVGGAGYAANRSVKRACRARKLTNISQFALDTDGGTAAMAEEDGIPFQLVSARGPNAEFGDNRLETARRFPERFGPLIQQFFDAFDDEEIDIVATDEGAHTRPFLGSIKFLLAEDEVKVFLRQQLNDALRTCKAVKVMVIGSAGGGTSAAGCPFLCDLLGDDDKREQLTTEAYRIGKPSLMCLPPLIQSDMQDTPTFRYRPLANAYAGLWEANHLSWLRRIRQQYVLHTCNDEGAAATDLEEAAEYMAEVLTAQAVGMAELGSRGADTKEIVSAEPGRRFEYRGTGRGNSAAPPKRHRRN